MNKYVLSEYKEFCKEAFVIPPADNFEEWIKNHKIHIIVDDCELELEYGPNVIQELEYSLQELYKIYFSMKFKYLSDSDDYKELKVNLDEWSLQHIDRKITEYEEMDADKYDEIYSDFRPHAVAWWTGCIDTESLIDYYKTL